jgi:HlyD family secretion protein
MNTTPTTAENSKAAEPPKDSAQLNPRQKIASLVGDLAAKKPKLLIGLMVALILLGGWWAYRAWQDSRWLTLYGNVDIRETNLGFRVFGKLGQVYKDEGDPVQQGELLAALDNEPQKIALNEARSQVEVSRAAAENAQANFERAKSLIGTRGISQEEFDRFQSNSQQATAQLNLSQAREQAIQTNLNDTQLMAPADGVIITRAQEPGTILQPGTTVLTLSLEKPVWVRAYINEPNLGRIHPGLEVELRTDSRPGQPYRGKVGYISPRAEFTPKSVETADLRTSLVYRLRVTVTDPDTSLRQGMPVTVRIPIK